MSLSLKRLLPKPIRDALRPLVRLVRRLLRAVMLSAVVAIPLPTPRRVQVNYGLPVSLVPRGIQAGGIVKFGYLANVYLHRPLRFNLLYLGSSALPSRPFGSVRMARRKGAKFVWN